jgi:uncharacterized membrane-anchored protein YitT (DUF2179 family)
MQYETWHLMFDKTVRVYWEAARSRLNTNTIEWMVWVGRWVRDIVLVVVGTVLMATALNVFLDPNDVVPGGFTALAIFANRLWGWQTGMTALLLNIPFLLVGTWLLGKEFGPKTIATTVLATLMIDWTRPYLPTIEGEPLLYIVYGGLLYGVGQALVYRAGATTGGIDIPAKLLERFYHIRLTQSLLAMDAAILLLAGYFFGLAPALYALIAAWVMIRVIDAIEIGFTASYTALIVTQQPDAIRQTILKMDRGVTLVRGEGGYTGDERMILYTVVQRAQLARLKDAVSRADPLAFMVINHSHDVLGEGFKPFLTRVR